MLFWRFRVCRFRICFFHHFRNVFKHDFTQYQEMHEIITGKKVADSSVSVQQQQPQFVVSAPYYQYAEPATTNVTASEIREEADKNVQSIFIPNTTVQADKNNMV